jgi:hypothetical protein
MPSKRLDLSLSHRTNIQSHRPGNRDCGRPVGKMIVRRQVIQPLCPVRLSRVRIAFRLPCPMKRRSRQHGSHHMIGMSIRPAISAKRNHHIRLEPSHPLDQPARSNRELHKLQLPIVVVQQLVSRHAEHLARLAKLLSPHSAQLFARRSISTIRRRLPIRQANHVRLDPTIRVQRQRSTKRIALIIRMRHDAHQTQPHSVASRSVSSNSNSAETASSTATSGSTSRTGAKLLRCSAQGPNSVKALRCSGVPYPL